VSLIDPSTLGTPTPRSIDGRTYPDHLRQYERFDDELLPIVAKLQPATYDDIAIAVPNRRTRSYLILWIKSAEWRGLIERGTQKRGPYVWRLGPQASSHLPHAA
jgi:hypothetical protein